jgi:hypothetical protein
VTALLSGLGAGGWGFVAGWLVPSIIAVGLGGYFVVPNLPFGLAAEVGAMDSVKQALVLPLVAAAVAVVLNGLQTPLYRVLEGYVWPERIRDRRIRHHRKARFSAQRTVEAEAMTGGLRYGLALEKLQRYPTIDSQVAPTALGNALRAFEVYGWEKYNLDSQTLWYELEAVAPDSLRTSVERARVPVDFAVSCAYLSAALSLIALLSAVAGNGDRLGMLAIGMVTALLAAASYRLAVVSTRDWRASVQALVNVGRAPLAEALGVQLPATVEEERRMWRATTTFVRREDTPQRLSRLNDHRKAATADAPPTIRAAVGQLCVAIKAAGRASPSR